MVIENNYTLDELGKILLYIIMHPVQAVANIPYGYKLSSDAERSEVKEEPKGCPILFCQNL